MSLSTTVVHLGPPVILSLLVLAPREQTADGSASRVVCTWGGRHFLFAQMDQRLFLLLDPLQEQNKASEGLAWSFLDFL